eukprot:1156385-Pelagomonas_calceolata.AAC.3
MPQAMQQQQQHRSVDSMLVSDCVRLLLHASGHAAIATLEQAGLHASGHAATATAQKCEWRGLLASQHAATATAQECGAHATGLAATGLDDDDSGDGPCPLFHFCAAPK